jgi:16S rRNA (guanine966-N2)-methyltransferase
VRIVAGRWRGRRITAPAGEAVRPTGDRIREAWMSIVHPRLPDARVLDLCAGSGALGLEALSRGAASCDFVDASARAVRAIESNLAALGGHPGARVIRDDAAAFVRRLPAGAYDIAFADPPYASDLAELLAVHWTAVPFAHLLGIEHDADRVLGGDGTPRRYGRTAITFFRATDS